MKIITIAGARPNFMKVAPIFAELRQRPDWKPMLVHTGQHYDAAMSGIFFKDLGLPEPDVFLGVGSGSHATQTAAVMTAVEPVLLEQRPDLLLVVGDVNSTLACTLVASKLGVAVAHVEAGLRSFDRRMPEEVNRVVTDALADFLFATEPSAVENLEREGVDPGKVYLVGNVMIDSLIRFQREAERSFILERYRLRPGQYGLVTLHRPSNVDERHSLTQIAEALQAVGTQLPLVFPIHPRTRERLDAFGLYARLRALENLHMIEPAGYFDFLKLMRNAKLVITDSGGIQEETTFLRVPCLTLRENTERPITLSQGTNRLVRVQAEAILTAVAEVLDGDAKPSRIPDLWDGHAAGRIVDILQREMNPR